MANLLMITGLGSVEGLIRGKRGAFYNTLEEFHKYWDRIDIIAPKTGNCKLETVNFFGNVFVHVSPWPLLFHPLWFIRKGLEIYRKYKFDIMTVQEFPPFYNGIGAKLLWYRIKVPYVLEIHHIPGYPRAANLKESIYRKLMKWFIKFDAAKALAVRVVNQDQTPKFLKEAGIPASKIIYIPSVYIDLETFKPMRLEKKYDLIFVGRLEKNKGIDLLLKTASKLKTQILSFKMIIVGDGPLKEDLEFKIKKLKLQNEVLLYGWAKDQEEIAKLINMSKILVAPSYNEGGPRVIVEAMACGVPVLATPVGIVPDLLRNLFEDKQAAPGGEIITWEAGDIVYRARELLSNSERYREYSLNGLETAKKFEKKEAIKNYANKLKSIL